MAGHPLWFRENDLVGRVGRQEASRTWPRAPVGWGDPGAREAVGMPACSSCVQTECQLQRE